MLLYGDGDFEQTVRIAVRWGFDAQADGDLDVVGFALFMVALGR